MNGTYNLIPKMTKIYIILLMSFLGIFNNLHAAIIDEAQIPYALSISGTDAVRIVLQSTGKSRNIHAVDLQTYILSGTANDSLSLGGVLASSWLTSASAASLYQPIGSYALQSGSYNGLTSGTANIAINSLSLGGVLASGYQLAGSYALQSGSYNGLTSGTANIAINSLSLGGVLASSWLTSASAASLYQPIGSYVVSLGNITTVSVTAGIGESTIFTGTNGQTITLPTLPPKGTINIISNYSVNPVTLSAGAATLNTFSTIGNNIIPIGETYYYMFDGGNPGNWYAQMTNDAGYLSNLYNYAVATTNGTATGITLNGTTTANTIQFINNGTSTLTGSNGLLYSNGSVLNPIQPVTPSFNVIGSSSSITIPIGAKGWTVSFMTGTGTIGGISVSGGFSDSDTNTLLSAIVITTGINSSAYVRYNK